MITFRDKTYRCTSEIVLSLVSGKWKIAILNELAKGPIRYNELRRLLPDATQRMLTMQLRMLESDGLISRKVYPVSPPKVEYDLSELGKQLAPMLLVLCDFGTTYIESYPDEVSRTNQKHA
ncbi:winged helix-turn-helix transcriptional regulator [Paenibacillus cookii]|jgi:DNA-binding HxlR family transcriptional regulator|uniref:Transcriptional regulator n=1 Tax=Paenibacillus cookii TaxID=157839 RepID=A0ABQ4M1R2_9BACL|nr:helix-turn-helix domain-containing protein [Paenibacillus cookii]KHF35409.1 putative HTH-type transcriptional regulator YtcD [Paenibacillus sp. P1XP2]GIO69353.1 transcriptional regulator [Paenibacillus cookii]